MVAKAETFMKTAADIKVPEKIEIRVREWLPYNNYGQPEVVEAAELNWAVPTLQRLWFG